MSDVIFYQIAVNPIPFELMAIVTIVWTMLAAFLIAPLMVWRKIKKHGATPEDIKTDVVLELEGTIDTKLGGVTTHFDQVVAGMHVDLEKQIQDITPPSFPDVPALLEEQRLKVNENLMALQQHIPSLLLQTLQTQEAGDVLFEIMKSGQKSLIGAWCRAKGIDEERFNKGVEITKEWFVNNVENVSSDAPQKIQAVSKIIKAIFPEEGDWVDEKIAALEVLQQNWHLIFGDGKSGSSQTHSFELPVGSSQPQQDFSYGGMTR